MAVKGAHAPLRALKNRGLDVAGAKSGPDYIDPKFHEAARTVFKRVQKDYPDSKRAAEAERQLTRLGTSN